MRTLPVPWLSRRTARETRFLGSLRSFTETLYYTFKIRCKKVESLESGQWGLECAASAPAHDRPPRGRHTTRLCSLCPVLPRPIRDS